MQPVQFAIMEAFINFYIFSWYHYEFILMPQFG